LFILVGRIKILNNIFTFLNKEFNYAVIHHIDEIVDSKKDIDFVIDVKKEDLYISFKLFSKINKYHTVNMYTIDINVFRIDIVYMNDIKQEYELLQLDLFTDHEKCIFLTYYSITTKQKALYLH
jgi:pyrimidine operon attenuation protein/uracil phosphoribosyltransferase